MVVLGLHCTSGWNYGLNAASLLGLSEPAAKQVSYHGCVCVTEPRTTGPAAGSFVEVVCTWCLTYTVPCCVQVLERAATAPAAGYRFIGFAPHMQDFDPSADHFANMNRCVQVGAAQ